MATVLRIWVLGLIGVWSVGVSHAQLRIDGFMKGQRKGGLAISYAQASYDTRYIGTTAVRDPNLGTVTTQSLTAYGVYGLDYDLDLIVSAPYVRTQAGAGYWPKQEGLQDISGALRWEAYDYKLGEKARLSWLFTVGYSMPLQSYVIDAPVALGTGSKNIDGSTMLHFKSGNFFLTGQFGYVRRGPVSLDRVVNYYDPSQQNPNSGSRVNVPDNTYAVLRAGIQTKRLYADVWGQQQTPYAKGTDIGPGIPYPTNGVMFRRIGATAYVALVKGFGFTGTYSTTLSGRNTGKTTQLSAGVAVGF